MAMENLNVEGLKRQQIKPIFVKTRASEINKLLTISFEKSPPNDPLGDLDLEERSVYDKKINIFSSPLEIIYDKATVNALISLFKTPDEINLANLQQQAFAKLKEYREKSALNLQFVIDNHDLMDVDIQLMSSYFILPHSGVTLKQLDF